MNILYNKNKKNFVTYHKLNSSRSEAPSIIFHHGLMSNMEGTKAICLEKYCKERDYNFIRFNNFGHGDASGEFSEQTISDWLEGLELVINNLASNKILLVGSSMGAWIVLLKSMKFSERIIGTICISAAPDFTQELMWDRITTSQKEELQKNGVIEIAGTNANCNHSYPIRINLIEDGKKHLILDKNQIDINHIVHLIHGMQDIDVPFSFSERVFSKLTTKNSVLKLIKDGDHSLSREKDMKMICNSIDEILSECNEYENS